MDKALDIVKLVAVVGIVLGTITIGYLMFNTGSENAKIANDKIASQNAQMLESDISIYDGMTVSGSDVLNAIRKFQNDYLSIEVVTGRDTSGTSYIYNSTESSGVINMGSEITFDITKAMDKTENTYINPTGRFLGSIYRDANGNIAKIKFEQQ